MCSTPSLRKLRTTKCQVPHDMVTRPHKILVHAFSSLSISGKQVTCLMAQEGFGEFSYRLFYCSIVRFNEHRRETANSYWPPLGSIHFLGRNETLELHTLFICNYWNWWWQKEWRKPLAALSEPWASFITSYTVESVKLNSVMQTAPMCTLVM